MSRSPDFSEWLEAFAAPNAIWYAKRLSGSDTWANGSRGDAAYLLASDFFQIFPELKRGFVFGKPIAVTIAYASQPSGPVTPITCGCQLVQRRGRQGQEVQITGLGGKNSPLLDPENTGALAVFATSKERQDARDYCSVWVCRTPIEEDLMEWWVGPIDPGRTIVKSF